MCFYICNYHGGQETFARASLCWPGCQLGGDPRRPCASEGRCILQRGHIVQLSMGGEIDGHFHVLIMVESCCKLEVVDVKAHIMHLWSAEDTVPIQLGGLSCWQCVL